MPICLLPLPIRAQIKHGLSLILAHQRPFTAPPVSPATAPSHLHYFSASAPIDNLQVECRNSEFDRVRGLPFTYEPVGMGKGGAPHCIATASHCLHTKKEVPSLLCITYDTIHPWPRKETELSATVQANLVTLQEQANF